MNILKQRLQKNKFFKGIATDVKALLATGDEAELIWYVQRKVHESYDYGLIQGGKIALQTPTGDDLISKAKSYPKR